MAIEVEPVDIAVQQNANEIYDVSFDEDGDFVLDRSYETSIRMSVWLDARADESEVKQQELCRGWWGNKELFDVEHEIGSKIWLLDQKRATIKTKNDAKEYIRECLQWLIDNDHAERMEVDATYDTLYELILTITIFFSADVLRSFKFNLWQNTEEF